jgi:membrane-bound serine protease (ClpP class)
MANCKFRLPSLPWLAASLLTLISGVTLANGDTELDRPGPGPVVALEIRGAIGVATSDYVSSGLEHARARNAELVLLRIDTPGGLVAPMRDIVQAILASTVPVATYVTPAGARADSAGTYILLASHVAAMTPTTHLGAATPVSLTGGDATPPGRPAPGDEDTDSTAEDSGDDVPDDGNKARPRPADGSAMEKKVINDSIAYIRSLADRYGRNADWAEKAVTDAATLSAKQALEQNVIEFLAENDDDLLRQLQDHEVKMGADERTLHTADAVIEEFEPNWRIKLLSVISNPEIVLILGMIGLYGLMYEGWNPGAIVPGVVGIICLLLAAYALQVIPVNYAGLALILVGLALMTAEAFAPSFGALGLGGVAAFVFGAIIMFDSGIPGADISLSFVIAIAILSALAIIWLVSFTLKLQRRGAVSGRGSIVGGEAYALESFSGDGKVWLEGEAWAAHSSAPIAKDQSVVVVAINGLVLEVAPAAVAKTAVQAETHG